MTNLTPEMEDELARLRAENAALREQKTSSQKALTFKVSDKGAVSVYGLQRFPVTLYKEQWDRLLAPDCVADLRGFIEANSFRLKLKGA